MPRMNKTFTTKVLGSTEMNNQTHLILRDSSGFETLMPESLVRDNSLKMENDDQLILTNGLYEMWFIKEKQTKLNENVSILFRNFHTLYKNKELILNNNGYKNLGLMPVVNPKSLCTFKIMATSSNDVFPARSPIPLIVTST